MSEGLLNVNGVYIEITNVCNLNCSFCPCGKDPNETRAFMSTELFNRAIIESSKIADNVYFHVLGEPTLHPNFEKFLKSVESTNLRVNLTTNGTTIQKVDEILLASRTLRQINFSTHAYQELGEDDAKRHLHNVLEFCKRSITKTPDLYINLRLWNVGDSCSDDWNHYMLGEINRTFETSLEPGHFCSRHKSFAIRGRIYLHQDSRFEWPKIGSHPVDVGTCKALDTHVAILHDGRVVACCLDYQGAITLGNIQENSIQNILNSRQANELRNGFATNKLIHPLCKSCNFCRRFKIL